MSGQEVPDSDLPDDLKSQPVSGSEIPPADLSDSDSNSESDQEVPESDLPDDIKYTTPEQQTETGFEGIVRGATSGLSDALAVGMRKAATVLGVTPENLHYVAPNPEEMEARKEQNPIEAGTSELAGNVFAMSKLPQIGSKAIDGMIKMGMISGGDELSKSMLGQGDPNDAVASHIAESGAFGLLGGALFGKAEDLGYKGLQTLETQKLGSKLPSWLYGIGHAASFPGEKTIPLAESALTETEKEGLNDQAFKQGQKFLNSYTMKAPKYIARVAAPYLGEKLGGFGGAAAGAAIEALAETGVSKASQNVVGPAILRAAASGKIKNVSQILDHATTISKGASKISNAVESLLNASGNKAIDIYNSDKQRQKLKEFIESGGTDQEIRNQAQQENIPTQGFSQGGKVNNLDQNPIAQVFPEQQTLLSASKNRISNYLNSVRPIENKPKLPFDSEHLNPKHERDYDKMLDLANNPLTILNHVKNGNLTSKHMQAFTSMFPDLHSYLSKKITEKISQNQLDENQKPPFHVRQALSLFLGSSLESSMIPQNIMAAQSVYAQQAMQKQMAAKASTLSKMSTSVQTASQGREERLNKN